MGKRQFSTVADGSQNNFDLRFAGILNPAHPTPRHDDPPRGVDYQKLTAALVLCAGEHAEAKPIAPADARIGFREKNRARVRAPPVRDAFSRRDGLEDDIRGRFDATYQSEAGHSFWPRASNSLRSA